MSLINIAAAALLISMLIFIHELGHFLFAKAFGVGVKSFSIGFGRRLVGFVHNGTDYKLCVLPFGGYVLMEGNDPFLDDEEMLEEKDSESSHLAKPIWQRLLIVAAGPLFNLLLPVVLFTGLYMTGEPRPAPVVGQVIHQSLAEEAGIQVDDRILSINGQELTFWMELYPALDGLSSSDSVVLETERNGVARTVELSAPDRKGFEWSTWDIGMDDQRPSTLIGVDDPNSPAAQAGLKLGDRIAAINGQEVADFSAIMAALGSATEPPVLTVARREGPVEITLPVSTDYAGWVTTAGDEIDWVDPLANPWGIYPSMVFIERILDDSAAQEAGLPAGARIVAIDDVGIGSWSEITGRISEKQIGEGSEASARPVDVWIAHAGKLEALSLTPRITKDTDLLGRYRYRAMIGVGGAGEWVAGPMSRKYYGFGESVSMAYADTKMMVALTVGQIGKLVSGKAAPSKSLGGPVQIFRDAGAAAKQGAHTWWRLMAVLSISLAIVNFLPVPVLDGGQFLFFLVEGIRGRPVSLMFRERAQQVGVLFLVALMMMVLVFDIGRLFGAN